MDSKAVFELRKLAKDLQGEQKLKKLLDALEIGERLFSSDPYDDWIQKALGYILIDLCKYYLSIEKRDPASGYYQQLMSIRFGETDKIVEGQKKYLTSRIDTNYSLVKQAEDLSKNGNPKAGLEIFRRLLAEKSLIKLHHEAYGWAIFRYLKENAGSLSAVEIKKGLNDYITLKNERPSLLHSMILTFALSYSRSHSDFSLFKFFKLWGPDYLRDEDKRENLFEGKEVPSLISRILRSFVDSDEDINVGYLIQNIQLSSGYNTLEQTLDLFREPFFWKIFNAHKEGKSAILWNLFEKYNLQFSEHAKSKWHSEILSFAERHMEENEEWRFLNFFSQWNPENFREEDWRESGKDGKVYQPLAVKCLKKAYSILKKQEDSVNLNWIISAYAKAVKRFPQDEWLTREYALLLIADHDTTSAIDIYKKLVLTLGNQSYIWEEFSSCFPDNYEIKTGMLSKAVELQKEEDFLGDIRMQLAELFLQKGLVENAIVELARYKEHRDLRGWKVSEKYAKLIAGVGKVDTNLKDNKELYSKYVPAAEDFAYSSIDWKKYVFVDIVKGEEGKERYSFADGKGVGFLVRRGRFRLLSKARVGEIFEFKLFVSKNEHNRDVYSPLLCRKTQDSNWGILEDEYAIVDYINKDRGVLHLINRRHEEIFLKEQVQRFQVGDIVKGKSFKRKKENTLISELKNISKISRAEGSKYFPGVLVMIDSVNTEKALFHYVSADGVNGIIKFDDFPQQPFQGKFLEICYYRKKDTKHNKLIYKPIRIQETEKTDSRLFKNIKDTLELKYKRNGYTVDFEDMDEDVLTVAPDFGFIGDYYVSKDLLIEKGIRTNCEVEATVIFGGDRWKVIRLDGVVG